MLYIYILVKALNQVSVTAIISNSKLRDDRTICNSSKFLLRLRAFKWMRDSLELNLLNRTLNSSQKVYVHELLSVRSESKRLFPSLLFIENGFNFNLNNC